MPRAFRASEKVSRIKKEKEEEEEEEEVKRGRKNDRLRIAEESMDRASLPRLISLENLLVESWNFSTELSTDSSRTRSFIAVDTYYEGIVENGG